MEYLAYILILDQKVSGDPSGRPGPAVLTLAVWWPAWPCMASHLRLMRSRSSCRLNCATVGVRTSRRQPTRPDMHACARNAISFRHKARNVHSLLVTPVVLSISISLPLAVMTCPLISRFGVVYQLFFFNSLLHNPFETGKIS